MSFQSSDLHRPATARPRRALRALRALVPDLAAFAGALVTAALAALLLGSLHGCGGGVGGEGTGSFAAGPITGFGSIIVNDVRFDDSSARIVDDDGTALPASALALGSVVQVSAGPITTGSDGTATAVASLVQVTRSLVGPLGQLDAATGRLVVLGQNVRVTPATVIDDRLGNGLTSLRPGQVVEVHGAYDASSGGFVATRVALAGADDAWRVRGPVAGVDTASQTFKIGTQTYSYASTPSGNLVRDGATLQLVVQASPGGQPNTWSLKSAPKAESGPGSGEATELRGLVTSVTTPTRFTVGAVTVDASAARISGSLRVGSSVRVSGTSQAGVLIAREVKVEDDNSDRPFEVRGKVTAIDVAARRLVVRGTTVSWARPGLVLIKGTLAQLAVGRDLRIVGVLSADRTVVEATEIRFED